MRLIKLKDGVQYWETERNVLDGIASVSVSEKESFNIPHQTLDKEGQVEVAIWLLMRVWKDEKELEHTMSIPENGAEYVLNDSERASVTLEATLPYLDSQGVAALAVKLLRNAVVLKNQGR